MNYEEIIVEKKGKITWLRLNRPAKRNALTEQMLKEWKHALSVIENDKECAVLIVKGEGKAWSAGVDLTLFQTVKVEKGFEVWEDGDSIIRKLSTMPQPTIAMVNGACFTGAMEIMLAFDMVFCANEAVIGDTHAKWGIPPKWGMTVRLMHAVGLKKAKELSFTAEAIHGKEAERIGLVNKSVPLEELESFVTKKAEQIAENSFQTIAAEKQLYAFNSTHLLEESLQNEVNFALEVSDKNEELKDFKANFGGKKG